MEVLHFEHRMRPKVCFSTSQTNGLKRKYLKSHIFIGHTRELSNRNKKSAKGVGLPETDWTANLELDGYSLVT